MNASSLQKPGKWCCTHVKIAWSIHFLKQRQLNDKESSKSSDSLRHGGGSVPLNLSGMMTPDAAMKFRLAGDAYRLYS
jgi:hypothetical protein